jgi:molecular chaperone GrpE
MKNSEQTEGDPSAATGGGAPDRSDMEHEPAVAPDSAGELGQVKGELQTLNDRHLRLAAEYSNYRRRAEGEMTEAWGRAQADLLRRFLDVLDDLQRVSALDPSNEAVSVQSVVEGIDLVERKFQRALDEAKVDVVDPAPGSPFDPGMMEAVLRVPAKSTDQDDTVDQVFQRGYRFRNQLVRPARVSVRKHE